MLHALPVWAADGTFTLSDRTEVRLREPDPVTNAVALDFDTLFDARATLASRDTLYTLAYLPRVTLLDINGAGIQPALINGGLASAEWHSRRVRIVLTEKASYGELSFESLSALPTPGSPTAPPSPTGAPTQLPSTQAVPPTQSVLFESSETTLDSTLLLRRWTVEGKVGYQLSGGATAAAQLELPFQHGPLAEVTADYRAGSRDHFATVAAASDTSFSNSLPGTAAGAVYTDDLLGQIEEQWRHKWARLTETMLSAGAYEARIRTIFDGPYASQANPVAEAAIDQHFVRGINRGEVRLDVRLAPIVNRLTGLVDQRIQGTLEGIWSRRRLTFRMFGTAAESVDQGTTTASRLLAGEIDASYRVSPILTLDAGARTIRQVQNEPGPLPATMAGTATSDQPTPIIGTNFSQSVLFFAVTIHAVKAKF